MEISYCRMVFYASYLTSEVKAMEQEKEEIELEFNR